MRHVYVAPDPGNPVPCGTLLGAITSTRDEAFDADAFFQENNAPEVAPPRLADIRPVTSLAARATPPARTGGRTPVAPAARAAAKKLGIDVSTVPGSGPGGRVLREDVEAWVERRRSLVEVADGVSLEVPTTGKGDPVLLLPGFGTDTSAFVRLTPVLAEHYRVRGVNPRGVGLSDAPEEEIYTVGRGADDAVSLLDGPAHVIGASLGAAVALEMALAHPDRVRSLTLITPFVEATPRLLAVIDAWCRLAAETNPETLASALIPWFFSSDYLADDRARIRTARGLAGSVARVPGATLARVAAGLRVWSGSRSDALSQIAVPTLVLAAGSDLLVPDAESVANRIPAAKAVVIPEAGHAVALEAPETVNEAISKHLHVVECSVSEPE